MSKRSPSPDNQGGGPKRSKLDNGDAADNLPEKEVKFLTKMMERKQRGQEGGVNYETLRVELGIGQRVKSQMAAWKNLQEWGYIAHADGGKSFILTEKGLEYAATPEYKEYIKDLDIVSATNEDHQDRIKKHLNKSHQKRGAQIFDFLVQYGSLTAVELAALCGTKRGSHKFSYALAELKAKKYVELDASPQRQYKGKLLRLADMAFLTSEDRPQPADLDLEDLAEKVKTNAGRKRDGKGDDSNGGKVKPKKVKMEKIKQEKVKQEEPGEVTSDVSWDVRSHPEEVKQETVKQET